MCLRFSTPVAYWTTSLFNLLPFEICLKRRFNAQLFKLFTAEACLKYFFFNLVHLETSLNLEPALLRNVLVVWYVIVYPQLNIEDFPSVLQVAQRVTWSSRTDPLARLLKHVKSVIKGGRKYSDDSEGPGPVCLFRCVSSQLFHCCYWTTLSGCFHTCIFTALHGPWGYTNYTYMLHTNVFIFDLLYAPFPSNQSSVCRCNSKQCYWCNRPAAKFQQLFYCT